MTNRTASPATGVSCIVDIAEISALHEEWKDLAVRTGADPFFHPDWFEVWWAHFGAGCEPVCIVLRQEGVLVISPT